MRGPRLLATVAAVDAAVDAARTEGGFGMSIAARAVAVGLGAAIVVPDSYFSVGTVNDREIGESFYRIY